MFGNPFSKDVTPTQFPNEKCRWCLARIGMGGRYPIPVCSDCFMRAYNHTSPRFVCNGCFTKRIEKREDIAPPCAHAPKDWPGNIWERLMTEFRRESFVWIKKMRATPTHMDVLQATTEAIGELVKLRGEMQKAIANNDRETMLKLQEEVNFRDAGITRLRHEGPGMVNDLEKEEK